MRPPERSNTKPPRTGDEERQALEGAFARYGTVLMPADAPQPILDAPTRRALFEWMAELNATKDMAALGVKPRRRMLLDGPPGCGKTTLAHHIAGRQGVPLVTVEGSSINAPHVGESAANIAAVFQIARKQSTPVALFFDEFDAVARKRGDGNYSHAEAEGATIALLSQMDKHKGILFAATNQPDRIDAAVQRRFEMRMTIELPGQDEREAIVRLYMKPLSVDERIVEALADAMTGGSPAIIKEMCEAIKRGLVLGPRLNMDTSFGALIRRAVTSVRPHEALAKPALWVNLAENIEALAEAADGYWPPQMPALE